MGMATKHRADRCPFILRLLTDTLQWKSRAEYHICARCDTGDDVAHLLHCPASRRARDDVTRKLVHAMQHDQWQDENHSLAHFASTWWAPMILSAHAHSLLQWGLVTRTIISLSLV